MQRRMQYRPAEHAAALGLRVEYFWPTTGRKGEYRHDERLIVIRPGMSHRQERCTLAHEIAHALAGDVRSAFGPVNARQESRADQRAAQLLVDLDEYRLAERLHGPHCGAIADELDVTVHMLAVWRRMGSLLVLA